MPDKAAAQSRSHGYLKSRAQVETMSAGGGPVRVNPAMREKLAGLPPGKGRVRTAAEAWTGRSCALDGADGARISGWRTPIAKTAQTWNTKNVPPASAGRQPPGCSVTWLARLHGVQKVAGSNPVTPT